MQNRPITTERKLAEWRFCRLPWTLTTVEKKQGRELLILDHESKRIRMRENPLQFHQPKTPLCATIHLERLCMGQIRFVTYLFMHRTVNKNNK